MLARSCEAAFERESGSGPRWQVSYVELRRMPAAGAKLLGEIDARRQGWSPSGPTSTGSRPRSRPPDHDLSFVPPLDGQQLGRPATSDTKKPADLALAASGRLDGHLVVAELTGQPAPCARALPALAPPSPPPADRQRCSRSQSASRRSAVGRAILLLPASTAALAADPDGPAATSA
jgi:hypothetical protein